GRSCAGPRRLLRVRLRAGSTRRLTTDWNGRLHMRDDETAAIAAAAHPGDMRQNKIYPHAIRANAMTEFQYARTELLDIAYFDRGNRDGFPVVLLHGWPDDALTWGRVSPGLIDAGFRVIVPYLRGFGPTRFISAETHAVGGLRY